MYRFFGKYIAILLLVAACDSGCIDSSSSRKSSVRSYNLSPASTYYSDDVNDFVLSDGFSSYQGICTFPAESQNPLTYSLRDYWYNTSLIFDAGYIFEANATGSAFFCPSPDENYAKEALYSFDYLNSKFIKFGGSTQLSADNLADGDQIMHWYNEGNSVRISADNDLNRIACVGDTGLLFDGLNMDEATGSLNSSINLTQTNIAIDLAFSDSSTASVKKGCLLELYTGYNGTGHVFYMSYPTTSEWPEYYTYILDDPLLKNAYDPGDKPCNHKLKTGRGCLGAIAAEAVDPTITINPAEPGISCKARLANSHDLSFPPYYTLGNAEVVEVPTGGERIDGVLSKANDNKADYVQLTRNCRVFVFPGGVNYEFDVEGALYPKVDDVNHPLSFTPSDDGPHYDPHEYYNIVLHMVHNDVSKGGYVGSDIAGKGNDNPDGVFFGDNVRSYKAYQDPSWAGSSNVFYPTIDKLNEGIKFDGIDDEIRIGYTEYPNLINKFSAAYSVYFYLKPTVKPSGIYTIYSILEGDSVDNQKVGDSLYIGADQKLYFAYDNNVYLVDGVTDFFNKEHEILIMREGQNLFYMLDDKYDQLVTIPLNDSSNFDDMSSLSSFIVGNIVAYSPETNLEDVIPEVAFSGYIKEFKIFSGSLTYEERKDFVTEQQGKWGNFVCDEMGTPRSIRMRIGSYISDSEVFNDAGEFTLPLLESFYRYNGTVLENATHVNQLNSQDIYLQVVDPNVDMCHYQSNDGVKEEYANNSGNFSILFKRSRNSGGGVIGNLYSIIVKPIERVLGHDFFKAFFDRVVGNCDSGTCTKPLFRRLLTLLLSLYVAMTGISLLFGLEQINKYELMRRIILIGIIFTLFSPSSWEFFNFYIIYFFQNGAMDLSQLVADSIFGTSGNYSTYANGVISSNQDASGIFEPLEHVSEIILSEDIHMKILSLLFSPPLLGFIMILIVYYSFFVFFHIAFKVLLAYATILVIMATGIVIAPFYFLFLLFRVTASFYEKWLSLMIGSALQVIFLACTVTFFSWIVYGLLSTIFNYAVCWGVIAECCDWIPGVNFKVLEFYVPSGYDLMLARFGYENIISSAPDFISVSLILVFMFTFKAFIEFSLSLGSKIGGASAGITGSVGQMMDSIDADVSKKGIEKGLNEITGGRYQRAKNTALDNIRAKTIGKMDNLIGHKTVEKQQLIDNIQNSIKNSKSNLLNQGEFDPIKREEAIKKDLESNLAKSGVSAKKIDKILNSKGVKRDINGKNINVKDDAEKIIRQAMQRDAGTGSDENLQKAQENIAKAIKADVDRKIFSGKSVSSAESSAAKKLDRVGKMVAKSSREMARAEAASKAEDSAMFSKNFARLKSKAASMVGDTAANIGSKMGAPNQAERKIRKKMKDEFDKS